MPIFEYLCDECGARFEKLVRHDSKVECPTCASEKLKTQFSTFSAHANGAPKAAAGPMPGGCGAGMCRTPDVCGRN